MGRPNRAPKAKPFQELTNKQQEAKVRTANLTAAYLEYCEKLQSLGTSTAPHGYVKHLIDTYQHTFTRMQFYNFLSRHEKANPKAVTEDDAPADTPAQPTRPRGRPKGTTMANKERAAAQLEAAKTWAAKRLHELKEQSSYDQIPRGS